MNTYPSWKDRTQNQFGKLQIQMPWRSFQMLVPHRMRRKIRSKLRSRLSPTSSISTLQTSFSPVDTLRSLQSHRWTMYDFQYLLLLIIGIFSLTIIQSAGPLGKTAISTPTTVLPASAHHPAILPAFFAHCWMAYLFLWMPVSFTPVLPLRRNAPPRGKKCWARGGLNMAN